MSHFFSQFCDDSDPIDLSWPDRWKDRIIYIIKAPLLFPMYYTALDCRRPVSFSYYSLKNSSFVYFASKVRYLQKVNRVIRVATVREKSEKKFFFVQGQGKVREFYFQVATSFDYDIFFFMDKRQCPFKKYPLINAKRSVLTTCKRN